MKVIKFIKGKTEYAFNLEDNGLNVSASRFQATILKERNSIENIAEAAVDNDKIQIWDSEDLLEAEYYGFKRPVAITYHPVDNAGMVSVELDNIDFEAQLNSLTETVSGIQTTVTSDKEETDLAIELINETVEGINNAISDLAESQSVQDSAIEDIADVVSTISEEIENGLEDEPDDSKETDVESIEEE